MGVSLKGEYAGRESIIPPVDGKDRAPVYTAKLKISPVAVTKLMAATYSEIIMKIYMSSSVTVLIRNKNRADLQVYYVNHVLLPVTFTAVHWFCTATCLKDSFLDHLLAVVVYCNKATEIFSQVDHPRGEGKGSAFTISSQR